MKKLAWRITALGVMASALAGHDADSTIWVSNVQGPIDSSWWSPFSTGSSDYLNVAHEVVPGIPNSDDIADGLPITGEAVSITDFGSGRNYATVGVFNSNLVLDPSGNTPNLSSPISAVHSPPNPAPPLYQYVAYDLAEAPIPSGSTRVHAVVQLPPGDSGLLYVGVDSTSAHPGVGTSGFTTDGYSTPSIMATFWDFGINPGQDNSTTTSCKRSDRKPHGRLRASNLVQGIGSGDHLNATVRAGDVLDLAFFGTKSGDKLRLYYNLSPCTPAIAIGPVLPAMPDADGDGSYLRVNATWPSGFGGLTLRFSAAWGNLACSDPGAGFTNCVTIVTRLDPTFGVCDDGTIESGWIVQIPSGTSDYFNNHFGDGSSKNGVVGLTIAVLDFGTAIPQFPTTGVSNANFGVDGTGHTPDIGAPLASVSPFTFPAGTFATTSLQYITHAISIPGSSLGTNVHVWLQFPPGDSGLLSCGADSSSPANACSYFSLDGYASASVSFSVNWGIRIKTN